MKVLTYNLWNSQDGMPKRAEQICCVLEEQKADILCLQEVWPAMAAKLAHLFSDYCVCYDAEQGLMQLCRYPVKATFSGEFRQGISTSTAGREVLVMNVHLPWNGAFAREKAIVEICREAETSRADYALMLGDFNCSDTSSVQRFLLGEQSLLGEESCWFDLGSAWGERHGHEIEKTVDFVCNTRWNRPDKRPNTIETSQRVDRILLKNCYPAPFPVLEAYGLFGKRISEETGLFPSDHYGVRAALRFE